MYWIPKVLSTNEWRIGKQTRGKVLRNPSLRIFYLQEQSYHTSKAGEVHIELHRLKVLMAGCIFWHKNLRSRPQIRNNSTPIP
jgi:hypothetical protein